VLKTKGNFPGLANLGQLLTVIEATRVYLNIDLILQT
jgi:hypothetical protein